MKQQVKIIDRIWSIIEKLAYLLLDTLFRIKKQELSDAQFDSFMQFIRFALVGFSNTVISYAIYLVALFGFRMLDLFVKCDYFVAQLVGFLLSVLWSFYWNNKKVFVLEEGKERCVWKALLKTYVSYSFTGLFLNSILIVLWVKGLNISAILAPLINLLISVPLNFFINKFWAFK